MNFNRIFGLVPVNRTAHAVTSQSGVSKEDGPIGKDEMIDLLRLMQRKSRLLKLVLKINSKSQHQNALSRYKKGFKSNFRDSRALAEYVRLGCQMQTFILLIAEFKSAEDDRQKLPKLERQRIGNLQNLARSKEAVDWPLHSEVLRRDGYKCMKCSIPDSAILAMHIIPVSDGGETVARNLKTVCLSCWESFQIAEVAA